MRLGVGTGLGEQQSSEETGVTVRVEWLAAACYFAEPLGLLGVGEHVEGRSHCVKGAAPTPRA